MVLAPHCKGKSNWARRCPPTCSDGNQFSKSRIALEVGLERKRATGFGLQPAPHPAVGVGPTKPLLLPVCWAAAFGMGNVNHRANWR